MAISSRRKQNIRNVLFEAQGGKCCYCAKPMRLSQRGRYADAATIEHLHRKADGGSDRRSNLAAACLECNQDRGPLNWLEFKTLKFDGVAS